MRTRARRGRTTSAAASRKVARVMHEFKRGELRSGGKGPTVKSRKQAIAIGLSEARREGDKVPDAPAARKKRTKRSRR